MKIVPVYVKISFWDMRSLPKQKASGGKENERIEKICSYII